MLIALSGMKGAGKDTAAEVLVNEYGFTRIAFADAVREMALVINPILGEDLSSEPIRLNEVVEANGWDYAKRNIAEVRRLLQVIGTEAGRMLFGEDVWIKYLTNKYRDIARADVKYVITDCRFENEAQFVKNAFGDVYWIDRPGLVSDGHSSESDVVKKYATSIFTNDESIEELQEDVRFLMFIRGVDPVGQ